MKKKKLKINDVIEVSKKEFTAFELKESGTAKVLDIIEEPNDVFECGAFPLLKVELKNGKTVTLTYRFFELDRYEINAMIVK